MVVVLVACAVFGGAEVLGGDGLLVCVVMGLLVVNKRCAEQNTCEG